jgi:hypothetical protein
MVEQLRRPTEQVEVFWFSEQPNGYVIYQPCNLLKSLSRIFVSQRTAARCAGHSV